VTIDQIGLWIPNLDGMPWHEVRDIAQELDELGYAALWVPEVGVNRDALVTATLLLDDTQRIAAATGIVPIYLRHPAALNAAWRTVSAAFPDRFVLGIGVSHAPMIEGLLQAAYKPPLAAMREYLDALDAAPFFGWQPEAPEPQRVLAALGPRMLALASERAGGAHTYNVTPEHTHGARELLGAGKLLAVEQKAILTTDATVARDAARKALAVYMNLPNYTNNWRRLGFGDGDLADGGSDRFVDAVVAWGDETAIRARVEEHLDAGADHVCVQALSLEGLRVPPVDAWRRLAPALLD
jgi:probable F420-dependent oxidoreductase